MPASPPWFEFRSTAPLWARRCVDAAWWPLGPAPPAGLPRAFHGVRGSPSPCPSAPPQGCMALPGPVALPTAERPSSGGPARPCLPTRGSAAGAACGRGPVRGTVVVGSRGHRLNHCTQAGQYTAPGTVRPRRGVPQPRQAVGASMASRRTRRSPNSCRHVGTAAIAGARRLAAQGARCHDRRNQFHHATPFPSTGRGQSRPTPSSPDRGEACDEIPRRCETGIPASSAAFTSRSAPSDSPAAATANRRRPPRANSISIQRSRYSSAGSTRGQVRTKGANPVAISARVRCIARLKFSARSRCCQRSRNVDS